MQHNVDAGLDCGIEHLGAVRGQKYDALEILELPQENCSRYGKALACLWMLYQSYLGEKPLLTCYESITLQRHMSVNLSGFQKYIRLIDK